ncbi:four helix bundle protein [Patescibacteria group bacterium]|nr:four helix bundle protein [Patescibacteria group bacterium]
MKDGYQSLIAWQKAMVLAREVYVCVSMLPTQEKYGLSDQLRRAAVSIPSNIAEGSRRGSGKEFVHFLRIAHGSLAEIETQLLLARDLYPDVRIEDAMAVAQDVGGLLYALARKIG